MGSAGGIIERECPQKKSVNEIGSSANIDIDTKPSFTFCRAYAVYTLGKKAATSNVLINEKESGWKKHFFFKTNRGGDNYHGPGQLVVYPIPILRNLYRTLVASCVIWKRWSTNLVFMVLPARDQKGKPCVVRYRGSGRARKICAIGVDAAGITMHGLHLMWIPIFYFNYLFPAG